MDIRTALQDLRRSLTPLYGGREAAVISDMVIEHVTGLPRIDRLLIDARGLDDRQKAELQRCMSELAAWRPVQYVVGEAWFDGLRFAVDERVLIPRPETEELVEWVSETIGDSPKRILDIGTGSGCIAVALKRRRPDCEVAAIDKSPAALALAATNASALHAQVVFIETDILDRVSWSALPVCDVIVSNPPYVTSGEKDGMRPNVVDHEPASAVFVEGADPLVFYRAIADFAMSHLSPGGRLFFETSSLHGESVRKMLTERGFIDVELRKDLQGHDRMAACRMP